MVRALTTNEITVGAWDAGDLTIVVTRKVKTEAGWELKYYYQWSHHASPSAVDRFEPNPNNPWGGRGPYQRFNITFTLEPL